MYDFFLQSRSVAVVKAKLVLLLVCLCGCPVVTPAPDRRLRVEKETTTLDGPRLALVIGNSSYAQTLKNPKNDARAMAALLTELGFNVMAREDLKLSKMSQAVREFGDLLKGQQGVGLFYYAGHGVQVDGENYLIPVDADIQSEDEVKDQALNVAFVLHKMELARNGTNIVILDACRDNPFRPNWRSEQKGLATISAPVGTFISYATAPGRVAGEGTKANGVYTAHLLSAMKVPGAPIEQVFKRVRTLVFEETKGRQVPWDASSLQGEFYFLPAPELHDDPDHDGVAGENDRCPTVWGPADKQGCPRSNIDSDKDGLADDEDKCPQEPGPKENRGCPRSNIDSDKDGLADNEDKCPQEPGPKENRGCPRSNIDSDKDGLTDNEDKCPQEPGPKENRGCPDKDDDGDGLIGRLDSCPDEPGPLENNGCPLADTDRDDIPDRDDKCPYEPGSKENLGCPPRRKFVSVTSEKIKLNQKISFTPDQATINPGSSFLLLDEVASVIRSRPTMRVEIAVHTDSSGTLQWNTQLSMMRAEAVLNYLINRGIAPGRLTAKGYGPTRPIGDNKTAAGREKNRRTEFVILQQ